MSRTLKARNKNRKIEAAAPGLPFPTENQMDHALAAFADAKLRYRLIEIGGPQRFVVHLLPPGWSEAVVSVERQATVTVKRFTDEASARQWREREIIREAITAGMRARP